MEDASMESSLEGVVWRQIAESGSPRHALVRRSSRGDSPSAGWRPESTFSGSEADRTFCGSEIAPPTWSPGRGLQLRASCGW